MFDKTQNDNKPAQITPVVAPVVAPVAPVAPVVAPVASVVETAPAVIASAIVGEDRTLAIRFAPNASKNAKAPAFRAMLALPGPLAGIVTELPIFKSDQGFSVNLPGGRFPSMRPANTVIVGQDGKRHETTLAVPHGAAKCDAIPSLVLTAFHAYLTTGEPEQSITLP